MKEFPHFYHVTASGKPGDVINTNSPGLSTIEATAPPDFGGPEGHWSPETLLVASVADCFVLTFRAIARASKFEWYGLECDAEGKLEKVERVTRFSSFMLKARLKVPAGSATEKAERLLGMAERNCLITNSLSAEVHLDIEIETVPDHQST
jgi:organic hydroperoxide reductase OsmC/OhrA